MDNLDHLTQTFQQPVTIHGNSNNVGISVRFNDKDIAVREWIHQRASDQKDRQLPDGYRDEVARLVFGEPDFQHCLNNLGQTLVMEGPLGIGKTTMMLGLLRELSRNATSSNQGLPADAPADEAPQSVKIEGALPELVDDTSTTRSEPREQSLGRLVVATIFFDSGDPNSHGAEKVLMRILHQLVQQLPDGSAHASELYHKHQQVSPIADDVAETIIKVIGSKTRTCLFLDALDECQEGPLGTVLKQIKRIQKETHIGALMTMRTGFRSFRGTAQNTKVRKLPISRDAIKNYILARLSHLRDSDRERYPWSADDETCVSITETILESSANIFLVAKLNFEFVPGTKNQRTLDVDLDLIRQYASDNKTSRAIGQQGYDNKIGCTDDRALSQYHERVLREAFKNNLHRAISRNSTREEDNDADLAILTLGFVRDVVRPISGDELRELLAIEIQGSSVHRDVEDSTLIRRRCLGLIEWDSSNQIAFVHSSLRDYLESCEGRVMVPSATEELGRRCAAYLTLEFCPQGICPNKESLESRLRDKPLLEYAAEYWSNHLRGFEELREKNIPEGDFKPGSIHGLALKFLMDDSHVEAASHLVILSAEARDQPGSTLYRPFMRRLNQMDARRRGKANDDVFRNRITGLHSATLASLCSLVKELLARLPEDRVNYQDCFGRTPLLYAAIVDSAPIVETLLGSGAEARICDEFGQDPLQLALSENKKSVGGVLLQYCAHVNVNAQTTESWLKHWDDPTVGQTKLHCAAKTGYTEALKVLLARPDIDIDIQDSRGWTALHEAVKWGRVEAVEMLVAAGSQLRQRVGCDPDGQPSTPDSAKLRDFESTVFHLASEYSHSGRVVEYLLSTCPDLCLTVNARGATPLHVAALRTGMVENMERILRSSADNLNAQDVDGYTALHKAISWGGGGIERVQLLLKETGNPSGIDINVVARKDGFSPLILAAEKKRLKIFRLLWGRLDLDRSRLGGVQLSEPPTEEDMDRVYDRWKAANTE